MIASNSEEQVSRMVFKMENMTQKEMLEKIAELDYSESHLRDLNAKMRHWLDVADDDMAALRTENTALHQKVKNLEKNISAAQQVEAEPCRSLLTDDYDSKRCREEKIQTLVKENAAIKEQSKKLTEEVKILQQQKYISLSKFKDAIQNLEYRLLDAQLGLQHRDEIIQQRDMQLKHSEEMVEEYSNIIEDLRLTNQELRTQLEDKLCEAALPVLNDGVGEKEGPLTPPLSFTEEMQLLASSAGEQTIIPDSACNRHEERDATELLEHEGLTANTQTRRSSGGFKRAGLLLLFTFVLAFLVFVASDFHAGYTFSINALWSGARLMLQPYCSVQYGALPPI